jgi:hypothetical protein
MKTNEINRQAPGRLVASLVLCGILAAALWVPAMASTDHTIRFRFASTGAASEARGGISFNPVLGREALRVRVSGLPAGTYTLAVNGSATAFFTVASDDQGLGTTRGSLLLRGSDGSLNFNPLGAAFAVTRGGTSYLEADFPATAQGAAALTTIEATLGREGTDRNAEGSARFQSRGGRDRFRVEVGRIDPGTYDLEVGGVLQGYITVDSNGSGAIHFDSLANSSDGAGAVSLTFDPRGQQIMVRRNGAAILSGVFPSGFGSGHCVNGTDNCPATGLTTQSAPQ